MFLLFSIFGNIKTYLPFGQSPSVPHDQTGELSQRLYRPKAGDWISVINCNFNYCDGANYNDSYATAKNNIKKEQDM